MHMYPNNLHDIPDYPNYKISDDLRVWSCKSSKFLIANNRRGVVSLYKNGVRKCFSNDMLYKILHPTDMTGLEPIPNLNGYFASKDGKIYSNKWDRFLSPSIDSDGYEVVSIFQGSKEDRKNMKVHRLVALTYIPNPHNFDTVDHLNNVKTDNRVENLEWVTASENTRRQWERKRASNKLTCIA